jgi:hypothetical protein
MGPCVCLYHQQSRRHEEEGPKKWTALCVAAWILACVIGDHLSAGHLVEQIEMWFAFSAGPIDFPSQKECTIRHRTAFRSVYLPCIKIVSGQLSPYRPNLCQKFSS